MAVIIATSANYVPGVSATISSIEHRTSKEEVVTVWIARIDGEVPETVKPIERTIEIGGCTESIPLPIEQNIAQIQIATLPVGSKHIVTACHTHQIVEVDFVCSLVLFVRQIQLVSHLVRQEQGLVTCLLVAYCLARSCCQQHHCQGYHHLFHNLIFLNVQQSFLSFLVAKIDRLWGIKKGFPLNSLGEIPISPFGVVVKYNSMVDYL